MTLPQLGDHVDLITDGIDELDGNGIIATDGTAREVDATLERRLR